MPLTRSAAEKALVSTVGEYSLRFARFTPPSAATGFYYPDLSAVLARTLEDFGYLTVDRNAVTDQDLAVLAPTLQGRYLATAELHLLESIRSRVMLMPDEEQYPDYRKRRDNLMRDLNQLIKDRRDAFRKTVLGATGAPEVGKLCPESTHQLDTSRYFPPYPLNWPLE